MPVPFYGVGHTSSLFLFNNWESLSSFNLIVQLFNLETWLAFGLMLERSKTSSQKRGSFIERQQMIDWITKTVQQKGFIEKESRQRFWTKTHFFY